MSWPSVSRINSDPPKGIPELIRDLYDREAPDQVRGSAVKDWAAPDQVRDMPQGEPWSRSHGRTK